MDILFNNIQATPTKKPKAYKKKAEKKQQKRNPDKILERFAPRVTPLGTIQGESLALPNHSGDHSAGHTQAPTEDSNLANKKYVDDTVGEPERLVAHVKEANVSAIKKGQMCAIVGSSGSKFEVQLCDCDDKDLIRVIGLAQTDTIQNASGTVIYKGTLEEVDTRPTNTDVNPNGETWLAGDMLFVSQTPGGLTKVRPTSGRCIKAGRTLKGSSVSDTLLAIVHTNAICACAASGEDMCSRMGDSAGVNKFLFKDYANNEVGAMDSNGNFTLSGTVDGVDVATDVAANTTHRGDNTQAHSDYLLNNASDTTSGTITAAGFTTTGVTLTGDHGTAATGQVINVCYGTGDPPAADTTTEGTLFVKYTA